MQKKVVAVPESNWKGETRRRSVGRSRHRMLLAGVFGATVALFAGAIGPSVAAASGTHRGSAKSPKGKPIIFGGLAATSGAYAIVGHEMFDAEQMAVAKLNASGGVLGRPVKLEAYNDKATNTLSAELYKKLVSAGAVVMTGSPATGPTTAALADKYHIVDIGDIDTGSLTIYPNGLSNPPRAWDYDTASNSAAYGDMDGNYALHHCKGLAVLHDPTAYGVGGNDAITAVLEKAGKKPALDEAISEDWSSGATVPITAEINKISSAGANCVVVWLTPQDEANFVRTAQSLGKTFTVLGNDDTNLGTTFTSLAGAAGTGVITAQLKVVIHPDKKVAAFDKKYEREFHTTPSVFSYGAYDGVMMAAKAIEKAKSTNENAIRNALNHMSHFPGLTGPLSLSKSEHQTMTTSELQYVKWSVSKKAWVPMKA